MVGDGRCLILLLRARSSPGMIRLLTRLLQGFKHSHLANLRAERCQGSQPQLQERLGRLHFAAVKGCSWVATGAQPELGLDLRISLTCSTYRS